MSEEATYERMPAPADTARFNEWLRATLGRRLTVVALQPARPQAEQILAAWRGEFMAYPETQFLIERVTVGQMEEALRRVTALDPDALLICSEGESQEHDEQWSAQALSVAESLNLFDRMLVAQCGANVTKTQARALGYEDGFSTEQSLAETLATLAREAITRESYRRQGSSPPCYL